MADRLVRALAVPIVEPLRVAQDGAVERTCQDLVGVGIDADLVRLAVAYDDEAERCVALVDQAMAGALAGSKTDVVAGLDGVALAAVAQRRLAFQSDDVLLLQHVVVERRGLLARRQLLVEHADLALILARAGQNAIAALEAHALAPFRPRHAVDGNRAARLFRIGYFAHFALSCGKIPGLRRAGMLLNWGRNAVCVAGA